jgi:photosynthetic reaction center H subunit
MEVGGITGYIDVAQIVLYVFWAFFAGLIFYLRREDRREGYPLLSEVSGRAEDHGVIWMPSPKTFKLADGRTVVAPTGKGDTRTLKLEPVEPWSGAPLRATGNPMLDGVGPASYAERADVPDVTYEGHARIVPLRGAPGFVIEPRDPDPRGMRVIGCDRNVAGVVTDAWVDRSEYILRYLEVALEGGGSAGSDARTVLLPINFCIFDKTRRIVEVSAITANQFKDVPALKAGDRVTLLEEDRICGYYGGGTLFATPQRQEALL